MMTKKHVQTGRCGIIPRKEESRTLPGQTYFLDRFIVHVFAKQLANSSKPSAGMSLQYTTYKNRVGVQHNMELKTCNNDYKKLPGPNKDAPCFESKKSEGVH